MLTTANKLTPLALLAGSALSAPAAAGTLDEMTQDARDAYHEGMIWATYAVDPSLDGLDLSVEVDGNKAILNGRVQSVVEHQLAEAIALSTEGINKVDNQIAIDPSLVVVTTTVSPQRSFARLVGNAAISAKVNSLLLWNEYTDGLDISVDADHGKVTLTGVADTENAKQIAERLAGSVAGVREVDNQLSVDSKSKGQVTMADDGDGRLDDTWIEAKLTSTLRYVDGIDAHRIDVESNQGKVVLSGEVDSVAERRLAIELAQGTRGVRSVDAQALTVS
ncbi:BON domain-containing protein [Pseudomarimonas arenosa]|uniref:BON domain-containing protein n=1 Tax=Pseudomarimonas arenosa TaxID=2774145 RepID=A0AAW3ZLW7_9GAMM|nr:BON domain-containing protein [Pseudomarimonas arenosa]MBD8526164.1 BON domain-containing protein [Pseudomarimonas arenosa]